MVYATTVYLSDDQRNWIDEMSLNVSKYVRSLIDRDMQRWKQITEDVLIPNVPLAFLYRYFMKIKSRNCTITFTDLQWSVLRLFVSF